MELLVQQQHVLQCFEAVLTKGDEARFRLYEVRPSRHLILSDPLSGKSENIGEFDSHQQSSQNCL